MFVVRDGLRSRCCGLGVAPSIVPRRRLVLASASPARLRLLTQAGFAPEVVVSGVDEDAFAETVPSALVLALATAKASAVAGRVTAERDPIVVGCDSLLDIDGEVHGKPADATEARARLRRLRGRTGVLRTGHCVIDVATGRQAAAVEATTVRFGDYDDDELDAYIATGEPLLVAGAFTLDGYAAPFIGGVDGDPSNVIGLSLPLLRTLLRDLGVKVYELWA
jgi:septum formation protein